MRRSHPPGPLLAALMPDEPEVTGLLALMLLSAARQPARSAPDGSLVLLADQDRSRWDADLVAEGQALTPTAVVALNRAVALAEVAGPDAALAASPHAAPLT